MTPWLLIVMIRWTAPTTAMMRFPDKDSCENARGWYEDHKTGFELTAVCLRDLTATSTGTDDGQPRQDGGVPEGQVR